MKKFLIILFTFLLLPCISFAKEKTHVNVAFTIDNNYPLFTSLVINSILKNNDFESDYTFWIIENNVSDKNKKMMKKFVEENGQQIEFIHFDTYIIDKGTNFFTFSDAITPIGMARIMIPDLLPKDVHKVIYLDSDMLVTADLAKLYNIKLGNKIAGMVKNIVPTETPDLFDFKDEYYNSGMILFDLDKCRKENSPKQMIDYLQSHKNLFIYDLKNPGKDKYKYPDQDLINLIWNGRIKSIDPRWNNQCIRGTTLINALDTGILHYIGVVKPWHFSGIAGYNYMRMYYEYWEDSPFRWVMYKYFFKKFITDYKKAIEKKVKRYKSFFKKIKNGSKEPVLRLFYVYNRVVK